MTTTHIPDDPSLHSDVIVKWLVPERVIYMWAAGDISASVRDWMNARAVFFYHSCSTPKIHIVIDMSRVTSRPRSTKQDRPSVWHSRRGWIISIGAIHNPIFRTLVNLGLRLFRLNYLDCSSIEVGLERLQEIDPSLPDLKAYWNNVSDDEKRRTRS